MANEISVQGLLTVSKPGVLSSPVTRSMPATTFTMSGTLVSQGSVSIGTSATAIPLGQVTAPHWAFFCNLDGTNYLTIRNGSGGADVIKLLPGEFAIVPLYDGGTYYAVAHTAACQLEYAIFSL